MAKVLEDNIMSEYVILATPKHDNDNKDRECEFCGELVFQHPEDQPWRFQHKGKIHWFCSYLCALRFFKVV